MFCLADAWSLLHAKEKMSREKEKSENFPPKRVNDWKTSVWVEGLSKIFWEEALKEWIETLDREKGIYNENSVYLKKKKTWCIPLMIFWKVNCLVGIPRNEGWKLPWAIWVLEFELYSVSNGITDLSNELSKDYPWDKAQIYKCSTLGLSSSRSCSLFL